MYYKSAESVEGPQVRNSQNPQPPISVVDTDCQIFVDKDNNWLVCVYLSEAQHSGLREI